MDFHFHISAEVWGIILVSGLILAAHAGLSLFDHWHKRKKFPHNNEVVGIVIGVLSLIYSLIVAFVIIAVWENYEQLNRTIEKEAGDLNSVLVHSNMLHDSLKRPVLAAVKTYCQKVVNEEWDMSELKARYEGSAIPSLRLLLLQAQTNNKINKDLLSIMDSNLSNITNLHNERLSHTRAYVPRLIWMILIIDSLMVISFSYFLQMESAQLRRIFLSFIWAIIGLSLFLVYMLDHPFTGSTQVSKAPYEEIMKVLENDG